MNIKLTCPVCGYREIEGNSCPNCDTNLSLIRSLSELPSSSLPVANQSNFIPKPPRVMTWQLGLAGIILLIGIGIGALGNVMFMQPQFLSNILSRSNSVTLSHKTSSPPNSTTSPADSSRSSGGDAGTDQEETEYKIQQGDSLSKIAERFCGKGSSWQLMVEANPQLEGRENIIDVGEVVKVPTCKEG